jgi:uncharacterized hydrophobic protein (TIGR00271 family)
MHLRLVVPAPRTAETLELLQVAPGTCNVVCVPGAAVRPAGDLVLCDVAREVASDLIDGLRGLGLDADGAITVERVEIQLSAAAVEAERAAPGAPGNAVVWELVEAETSEAVELTASFLAFMVIAALIAMVGIFQDSPILIVGAMVVGPEFGPLAGICVALVEGRRRLALRSLRALAVGFPVAILVTYGASQLLRISDVTAENFSPGSDSLARVIASPDFYAFFVAFCAGVAGMLSLTAAKSSVLIGVLISVTTIPAAANIAVSAAYSDWGDCRGSLAQLGLNLGTLLVAGTLTLAIQGRVLVRRRR